MKLIKKLALLLALLLVAVPFLIACDGISAETADELLSLAGEMLSDYADEAKESAKDAVSEALYEAEKTVTGEEKAETEPAAEEEEASVVCGQAYRDTESVAAYLHLYGELPPNYLTKNEAEGLGWVSSKGNLWDVTDHGCIGGDRFGNYEGLLPTAKGRKYFECDVNYEGGYRGSDRIIFSNDGLIYFTGDHYASFTLLYGEE